MAEKCTAIITFRLVGADLAALLAALGPVDPVIRRQPGLLELRRLVKDDESAVVTILTWENRTAHDRCQTNPEVFMAGGELMRLIQRDAVDMQLAVYTDLEDRER